MKLVIFSLFLYHTISLSLSLSLLLSLSLSLSPGWHVRQVAAVQVLVALLYRTVPCCTVLYCILVFVLTFCMSVASVKCMHTIVALHYLFYPSACLPVCLWGVSVCLPVSPSVTSSCLSALLSGLRGLIVCLSVCLSVFL